MTTAEHASELEQWYLLKTRTRFEPNACRHIEHPAHAARVAPSARAQATCLPTPCGKAYLPGYLFARGFSMDCLQTCFSANPRLFLVFSHIDQHKQVVMAPFMATNNMVQELAETAANSTPVAIEPDYSFLIGKKIRIPHGAFMGHLARVKSVAGAPPIVKLKLYNNVLGRSVQLSMNLEDLA